MKSETTNPMTENVNVEETITTSGTPQKYKPSKFVFADNVFKGLEVAFKNEENIVLYGAGE